MSTQHLIIILCVTKHSYDIELKFRILSYTYKVGDGIVSSGSLEIAAKNWDGGRIIYSQLLLFIVVKPARRKLK